MNATAMQRAATRATIEYITERRGAKLVRAREHGEVPQIEHGIPVPVKAQGGSRHFEHHLPV